MKKLILVLAILPSFVFAVSNEGVERESVKANVTIMERCTTPRYRFSSNYLQCLNEKRKLELEAQRKLRNSIRGRTLKNIANYRGSRKTNQVMFTVKPQTVSDRPLRTFSGTKRYSIPSRSGNFSGGIYRGTVKR